MYKKTDKETVPLNMSLERCIYENGLHHYLSV